MSIWPEADAKLTARWLAGVPCPEIGRELGVSGHAIIGRAHRIGLPRHASVEHRNLPPAAPRNRRHRRVRMPAGVVTLAKLPSVPGEQNSEPVRSRPPPPAPSPATVPRGTCQFIFGDVRQPGWKFCGATVSKPGSPWCANCRRVVFHPRQAQREEGE